MYLGEGKLIGLPPSFGNFYPFPFVDSQPLQMSIILSSAWKIFRVVQLMSMCYLAVSAIGDRKDFKAAAEKDPEIGLLSDWSDTYLNTPAWRDWEL